MSTIKKSEKKVTAATLQCMKKKGKKIAVVTAYDATFAKLADMAGAEVIMIGDSLGMVVQGHKNTIPVTIDDIVYHTRAVKRGAVHAHIVSDMPFMSYQSSVEDAVRSAGKLVKVGGAEAVKIEGGTEIAKQVEAITSIGIPVMGHIGLQPQSVHKMGGYKIQGKTAGSAKKLMEDALSLQKAGAYSIVLEGIAMETAAEITKNLFVPTIGIGSGAGCDGQVLVIYDLLGMDEEFSPKFVKKYADLSTIIKESIARYNDDVKRSEFPAEEHGFHRLINIVQAGGQK